MKIRIKEFGGRAVTQGFFPKAGTKMRPGDIYECDDEDHFHACLDTGIVEAVVERSPRGRPRKVEEAESG